MGATAFCPARSVTDALFRARLLESQQNEVPVLDRTGLSGRCDFRIRYAPGNGAADSSLPSLFTAVQIAAD